MHIICEIGKYIHAALQVWGREHQLSKGKNFFRTKIVSFFINEYIKTNIQVPVTFISVGKKLGSVGTEIP